jgi:hypothetical protein
MDDRTQPGRVAPPAAVYRPQGVGTLSAGMDARIDYDLHGSVRGPLDRKPAGCDEAIRPPAS